MKKTSFLKTFGLLLFLTVCPQALQALSIQSNVGALTTSITISVNKYLVTFPRESLAMLRVKNGTCVTIPDAGNPDAVTDRIPSTAGACIDRYNRDTEGFLTCPARAATYLFSFNNADTRLVPGSPRQKIVGLTLGKRNCEYLSWMEARPVYKQAVLWDRWTIQEKKYFYGCAAALTRGEDCTLRKPWEGPEIPRELCHDWEEAIVTNSGSRWNQERLTNESVYSVVDPGGCKDWRGTPSTYTDAEKHKAWIGRAAVGAYVSKSGTVSWDVSDDPELLAADFNPDKFDIRFTSSYIMDAPRAFHYIQNFHLIDPASQYQTAVNLIRFLMDGDPVTGEGQIRHVGEGCHLVPREIVQQKAISGEPILASDFIPADQIHERVRCEYLEFDPPPPDYVYNRENDIGTGCNGIGMFQLNVLNIINIPQEVISHGHVGSKLHLDGRVYGIAHNDELLTYGSHPWHPERVLLPAEYIPRIFSADLDTDSKVDLGHCLTMMLGIGDRCLFNSDQDPYPMPQDPDFCRSRVEFSGRQVELLTAAEQAQLLDEINLSNQYCRGGALAPRPD